MIATILRRSYSVLLGFRYYSVIYINNILRFCKRTPTLPKFKLVTSAKA